MDKEKSAHFKHYIKSAQDFIAKVSKCSEKKKLEQKTVGSNAGLQMICVKFILLFLNLFYIMMSWLMVILGIYVPSIFWTVNAVILSCIAIFGINTALKQSSTLAYIYGFVMMITFILQIVAAISTFSLFFNAELQARIFLSKIMEGYSNDNMRMYTMNWIQKSFQCCGNDGPIDWSYYSHYGTINTYYWDWYIEKLSTTTGAPDIRLKTPTSCCLSGSDYQNLTCDKYFQNGCAIQIRDILSENTMIIGSSALALAVVELLGMVIAFKLARLIRQTTYTHIPIKRDEQSSGMIFDTSTCIDYSSIAKNEQILWLDHKEILEIMSVK